jgi:ferredoxin
LVKAWFEKIIQKRLKREAQRQAERDAHRKDSSVAQERVFHYSDSPSAEPVAIRCVGEATILDAVGDTGLELDHSCGGMGSCGTCRVMIEAPHSAALPARNEIEAEMAAERGFAECERLGCQTCAADVAGFVVRRL